MKQSLKEMRRAWKEARKRKPEERKQVKAGTYQMQCVAVELVESKSSGDQQLRWRWRIKTGEYKGESIFDYTGLTDERVDFTMRRIGELGWEVPDTLDELEEVLEEIRNDKPTRMGQISYQQGSDFPRLRLQQEEEEDEPEEDEPEEDEGEENSDSESEDSEDSEELPWDDEDLEEEEPKPKKRGRPRKKTAAKKKGGSRKKTSRHRS